MKLSVVVAAYNMRRELPRTILSLSPRMQQEIDPADYEVIVVDNGSSQVADLDGSDFGDLNLRTIIIPPEAASPSPARALNVGRRAAQGELVGLMIDGARMASPGLLAQALRADRLDHRAVILSLGFHLGSKVQMISVQEGYDQDEEDRLLGSVDWRRNGYQLFSISVFAGSARDGWFRPISESNALFMRDALWEELGGMDERFQTPGGGLVNLDTLSRAVDLPNVMPVTLLGEGTFHQVHGGVATNAVQSLMSVFEEEYLRLRNRSYKMSDYDSMYLGKAPPELRDRYATEAARLI